jgi:hypothetical protein
MNSRTALGAGFVLLAVLAGALFLDRAQRLVPVYAAARDLPTGTPLRSGDLMVVRSAYPIRRRATTCGRAPTRGLPAQRAAIRHQPARPVPLDTVPSDIAPNPSQAEVKVIR